MARLRRSKLLTCFYCGKRSSIANDGTHRDFLCMYCDATNYVDENGEITDPPVATEREPPAPRYVQTQTTASPPRSPVDSVFCATCLKNQRLYTASLAQYLPDESTEARDEPLGKKYYQFRRDLEERYPQVCDDCEGRVHGRIQAAGYTAQTDHLRRLMANTRTRRSRKKLTSLDLAERIGRYVWWAGLVLQMLWHIKMVSEILESSSESSAGMSDPDAPSFGSTTQRKLSEVSRWLPAGETLMRGSIIAAIASVWWNPRFIQVSRGFSRHLLGFRQWYCFQGLIVFFRIVFRRVDRLDTTLSRTAPSPVMPHLMMAGLMLLISVLARKSIRVNTQALFGFSNMHSAPSPPRNLSAAKARPDTRQVAAGSGRGINEKPAVRRETTQARTELKPLPTAQPPAVPFRSSRIAQHQPFTRQPFGAPESPILAADEPEEMDWTPTQSQHRAFSNEPVAGSPSRPFSQAPVEPESGPFWYKVPPAPQNPAQKLRNPPKVPIVRTQPTTAKVPGFSLGHNRSEYQSGHEAKSTAVEFQSPTFFAPVKEDERNSLADMLNKSFSLGNETEGDTDAAVAIQTADTTVSPSPGVLGSLMPVLTGILLLTWILAYEIGEPFSIPYTKEVKLCTAALGGGLALRRMGQSVDEAGGPVHPRSSGLWAAISPLFEVLELCLLCYVGWGTWTGQTDVKAIGFAVLSFGFLKHVATAINAKGHRWVA